MGRRPSYTDEELRQAVAANESMAGTLRALGLVPAGGNYKVARRRIQTLDLDTSHWSRSSPLKGKSHNWSRRRPLEEILVARSDYTSTTTLKKRLLRVHLLEERCATPDCMFHRGPLVYCEKPVTLHLDHVNGDNRDNRLENLRLALSLESSAFPTTRSESGCALPACCQLAGAPE